MKRGNVITVLVVVGLILVFLHGRHQSGTLPNLRGQSLETAQDNARKAGFNTFTTHDARGTRLQLPGQHWTVCTQTPPPGVHPSTTSVDLAVVKRGERCPG